MGPLFAMADQGSCQGCVWIGRFLPIIIILVPFLLFFFCLKKPQQQKDNTNQKSLPSAYYQEGK